jgi:hypothetical protein
MRRALALSIAGLAGLVGLELALPPGHWPPGASAGLGLAGAALLTAVAKGLGRLGLERPLAPDESPDE